MKFTERIAQYIIEQELDTRHLTIVLPSERAKKYIAAALYKQHGKALVAPEMVTIDRWVRMHASKTVIDKTRALVRLFEVQLQTAQTEKDRQFDEFLEWGPMLLSDFDEVDRYLLDPKHVFRNLADIKELESWQVDESTLSESRKRFMEFWDRLPGYYQGLNERLSSEGMCYMGGAYREVAERCDLLFQEDRERRFLFAGFNALSAAEIAIIRQLHRLGRAHILIDADRFYLESHSHEAGQFIRQLLSDLQLKTLPYITDKLSTEPKHIEMIECPQTTGQVKVMSTKLQEMSSEEVNETLILLADETLITPLLKNLPKKVGAANITLGMPLRNSALRNWVELLFLVQENKQRFRSEAFYHSDLLRLLSHPFLVNCATQHERDQMQLLEQNMLKYNSIFVSGKNIQLGEKLDGLLQLLAVNWQGNWALAIQTIRRMNTWIYKGLHQDNQFERALIEGFDKALIDFENIAREGLPDMSLRSFKGLFNQHWSNKSIAYHGNPITGLQIMGLLETRLLDFKNILCLGLNEGTMPPTNPIQTMLPMDLRRYLHLPTPREKQGLFAHHFYRLLHHCEYMLVTYTSASEAIGSNERSRYLLQLELELQRVNKQLKFEHKYYTIPTIQEGVVQTVIRKTPEILVRMDELFAHSTSITALKNFFSCPLDFYYKYILEFGEEDTVEEEVEHSTFGTFVHDTLEELFKPYVARQAGESPVPERAKHLTVRDLDKMLDGAELILRGKFMEHFNFDQEAFASGKNLLSFRMALELIRNFLNHEKTNLKQQQELRIESVEEKIEHDLEIEVFGQTKRLHLKGIIDRIDVVNGKTRIVDYKTGAVKREDVTISQGRTKSVAEKIVEASYSLQLLTYCYLYRTKYGVLPDEVGIFPMVNIHEGFMPLQVNVGSLEQWVNDYPTLLTELMESIYDPETGFEHQESGFYSYCRYCK